MGQASQEVEEGAGEEEAEEDDEGEGVNHPILPIADDDDEEEADVLVQTALQDSDKSFNVLIMK